jgi:hypothetical protein
MKNRQPVDEFAETLVLEDARAKSDPDATGAYAEYVQDIEAELRQQKPAPRTKH